MTTIKAPFNFVPLSEKVFFPDWSDKISHDVPFEDSESGIIELKITAETPIFVRNGHSKDDEEKNYESFSHINGKYFIPASSLKGAVRNVLEIMSFGKMRLDKNAKFAQREWDNTTLYTLRNEQKKFFCGYLIRQETGYGIVDCGKPFRIGHKQIDEKLGQTLFENNFSKDKGIDLNKGISIDNKEFDPKTAIYKYELIKHFDILKESRFTLDTEYCKEHKENRLKFSKDGEFVGRLVLTGQPDKWKWPRPQELIRDAGKFYEFVFLQPKQENIIPVTEKDFNHFKFIYSKSVEWDRAKKLLEEDGIPVFFRREKGQLKDFGLAYLYKLPYNNSPYETLSEEHKMENKPDLADCLFGFTNKENSLKGRVQFSPAFSDNALESSEIIFTFGSPKASYYPIYIKQDGKDGITPKYLTYNDGKISGWKRYMIRKDAWVENKQDDSSWGSKTQEEYISNLDTIIKPVEKGAVFTGKIRFHNLRKEELGALLSALTFHNSEGYFHQIGQGKPYGFGKVKIEVRLPEHIEHNKNHLMALFEDAVSRKFPDWPVNNSIVQLFTMAKEEITAEDVLFKYMHMDTKDKEKNEFITAKSHNEFLQEFIRLKNSTYSPISLVEDLVKQREKESEFQRMEEQKRKEDESRRKAEEKEKSDQENLLKKIESGLSFLDEKYDNGDYKIHDFNGARKRIDNWLKKADLPSLPEDQEESLKNTLFRLYSKPDKKEKSDWSAFSSSIWKIISKYIGEEKATIWFNDIVINR